MGSPGGGGRWWVLATAAPTSCSMPGYAAQLSSPRGFASPRFIRARLGPPATTGCSCGGRESGQGPGRRAEIPPPPPSFGSLSSGHRPHDAPPAVRRCCRGTIRHRVPLVPSTAGTEYRWYRVMRRMLLGSSLDPSFPVLGELRPSCSLTGRPNRPQIHPVLSRIAPSPPPPGPAPRSPSAVGLAVCSPPRSSNLPSKALTNECRKGDSRRGAPELLLRDSGLFKKKSRLTPLFRGSEQAGRRRAFSRTSLCS